jgi:hypothetical protein
MLDAEATRRPVILQDRRRRTFFTHDRYGRWSKSSVNALVVDQNVSEQRDGILANNISLDLRERGGGGGGGGGGGARRRA